MDFLLEIIELTGLPRELVEKEFFALIDERGLDSKNLGLDNIREILAIYMQDTLIDLKNELRET